MENIKITYQDKLALILNSDCEPIQIDCDLPVLGEGNNRIVYDLGDKVLKVAKSFEASVHNQNEYKLWESLGEKSKILKINRIFEIDDNGYWYVAEKIDIFPEAMKEVLRYISWFDYSVNAGYDSSHKLTIVDAENISCKDITYLLDKGII